MNIAGVTSFTVPSALYGTDTAQKTAAQNSSDVRGQRDITTHCKSNIMNRHKIQKVIVSHHQTGVAPLQLRHIKLCTLGAFFVLNIAAQEAKVGFLLLKIHFQIGAN